MTKKLNLPSKEEWDGWLSLPETQALRQVAAARKKQLQERWSSGEFTDLSQFGTAILNAKAIGQCEAYQLLEELDYESVILGELADEEPQRPGSERSSSTD